MSSWDCQVRTVNLAVPARIRSVIEGPDGALWVFEDECGDSGGRLLKFTPTD